MADDMAWLGKQVERILLATLIFAVGLGLLMAHHSLLMKREAYNNLTRIAVVKIQTAPAHFPRERR